MPITFPNAMLCALVTDGGNSCYSTGTYNWSTGMFTIAEKEVSGGSFVIGTGRWFSLGK
ncbi:hypothetical protein [Pectinatus frisingensis]|uniref:gp53-like domain-containing protein n=1 Tax=Pectinatus frisingensis TaxID=865 RepID=UPI0018C565A6|nr:hypothetical protein [Pectinatus frisingensis]